MKKILGLLLILIIVTTMLSVAALPAIFWLEEWFKILSALVLFFVLIGVQVLYFGHILSKILDKLIKDASKPNK